MTNRNFTLAAGTLLMASTPASLAAAGGDKGLFEVNLGLSIWATVVFFALLFILRRFAWGPILDGVEARERGIQDAIDESRTAREEARKLLEEHQAQLADARRQSTELIAEGKAAGDRLRKELEEKARADATEIIEAARREITRERDAALADIRKESVDIALAAAARLMQEKMDADKDRQVVDAYLDQVARGREAEA